MVVFGGIEYVVTVTLHGDALGVAHWMFVQLVPSINYTVFPAVQGSCVRGANKADYGPKKFMFDISQKLVTDLAAYSDTHGTREKCYCKQGVTGSNTF